MKKTLKKTFAALAVFSITACYLTSCGNKYDTIYYEDENEEIVSGFNENMFSFHMSMEKTTQLYSMGLTADYPELWSMSVSKFANLLGMEAANDIENLTIADIADKSAVESAKKMVVAEYLYDTMKGEETVTGKLLADADKKLEAQVDNTVSQLQLSIGSKEQFESFISGFGITLDDFRKYYEMSYKATSLRSSVDVSEEEKQKYFLENYSTVKHILINTNSKTNDAGEKVSLTDEEKQTKLNEVTQIEARLSAGEAFEDIFEEYKDTDPGNSLYPNGYLVTDDNAYMPEFQNAALTMEEGEIRTVYTDYGAHIMKKYPTDVSRYTEVNSSVTSAITDTKYTQLLTPYLNNVKINDEVVSKYSVATVSYMNTSSIN